MPDKFYYLFFSLAAGTISLWGNQRIDYLLEAPSSVEQFKSLPVTVHAHVIQARYWEAKELVSFVLRQVMYIAAVCNALHRTAILLLNLLISDIIILCY